MNCCCDFPFPEVSTFVTSRKYDDDGLLKWATDSGYLFNSGMQLGNSHFVLSHTHNITDKHINTSGFGPPTFYSANQVFYSVLDSSGGYAVPPTELEDVIPDGYTVTGVGVLWPGETGIFANINSSHSTTSVATLAFITEGGLEWSIPSPGLNPAMVWEDKYYFTVGNTLKVVEGGTISTVATFPIHGPGFRRCDGVFMAASGGFYGGGANRSGLADVCTIDFDGNYVASATDNWPTAGHVVGLYTHVASSQSWGIRDYSSGGYVTLAQVSINGIFTSYVVSFDFSMVPTIYSSNPIIPSNSIGVDRGFILRNDKVLGSYAVPVGFLSSSYVSQVYMYPDNAIVPNVDLAFDSIFEDYIYSSPIFNGGMKKGNFYLNNKVWKLPPIVPAISPNGFCRVGDGTIHTGGRREVTTVPTHPE